MRLVKKVLALTLMVSMLSVNMLVPTSFAVADTANNDNAISSISNANSTGSGYAATDITFAPGQNATELNFDWYSNVQSPSSVVQVAKKADMAGTDFPADKATQFTGAVAAASTGFFSNKVTVTGLQESTAYVYRVGDGSDANWSPVYSFTTHQTDSFSFLSVGDPQIGASGSVASDTAGWKDTMSKALAKFPDVSFLAALGDQINDKTDESEYTGFFAPPELRSLPVSTLIGNHENGAPNYSYHFNPPNLSSQYGITANTSSDYYFTYGNTLFMVLNTNNPSGAEHDAFMQQAINSIPNATWKVVMFHQDIYGSADHSAEASIVNIRQALFPVFDKDKIDLVLDGHDHSFTRTYQMLGDQALPGQKTDADGAVVNPLGTLYMTLNSGSGSKYYDLMPTPETYAAVRSQIKVPTFSKITETANSMNISTYRTDTMAMTDTYTIKKQGSQPTIDLSQLTLTSSGNMLATEDSASSVKLSLAATDSQGADVDLSNAYVLYQTDKPDLLAIASDGSVTVKNKPAQDATAEVWAEVYNGNSFVSSNKVNINVKNPYGLAEVSLAANSTTLSADSAPIKLNLTGKDTTGATMDLTSATVEYKTDKDGVLAISSDGTVTVQTKPDKTVAVKISADVTVGGKTVTSNTVSITVSSTSGGTEIIAPVKNALDDMEERPDGSLDYDSSDLEITWEKPTSANVNNQLIGIRFADLGIPKGAKIIDAYIQFSVDEPAKSYDPFDVNIYAEDVPNSAPFENVPKTVSTRVKTANSVEWKDAPLWTTEHEEGPAEQTSDLSSLVQEIVNKDGWNSGNAISFILSGEGNRTAESFEGAGSNLDQVPTLHLNYTTAEAGPSIAEARDLGAGQTATVTGIVTCVNPTSSGSYFIQDSTAGINVYNTSLSPTPQLGDKIQVTGPMTLYKGLLEMTPAAPDVSIVSSANPLPEPKVVTIDQLGDNQSQLIKLKNVTLGNINTGGSTTLTDDAGNSTVIYQIPTLSGINAGDKVDVIAIDSAYNTPELLVRSAADIVKTGSISAARNLGVGQTATVTGVVTYTDGKNYYIQDNTAGVNVYVSGLSPAPQQGDQIKATGPLSLYNGLLEMEPAATDVSILSSNNTLPAPKVVTIDQVKDYESQLITLKNVTLGTTTGSSTPLTDANGNTLNIYKMPSLTGIKAGDAVDVTAVASIYNTPQLLVQNSADITKATSAADKKFDIVEVTDLHGNIGDTSSNQVAGVMAENIKDNVYANNPDRTLILSGGDNYQGTAISNLEYGAPVMKIFNYMGVAASALGNHEFDWGLDKVTSLSHPVTAQYPIICANLFPKGNTTTPVFDPYKIFTLDGVKIAVVGGITETTPGIVLADYIKDYDVLSNVTYINKYAEQARMVDGAQVVIALIHEGDNLNGGASGPIVDIAKNLVGVDAVLGGHTHDIVNTTVTTNAGKSIPLEIANYNGNGYIDLQLTKHEDGSVSFDNANTAYVAENTSSTVYPFGFKAANPTVDQTVKQIVADTMTEEGPILNEVLGSAQINLDRTQADTPYGESLVGDWAADVTRNVGQAEFGFQNNGGLRCDIPQGQIAMSTIYQFMPFDNTIETCDMTGAQLKLVLEQAVGVDPSVPAAQQGGKGIQVSGLKFTYDPSKDFGSRVLSLMKSDGTPINMNDTTTTYKVATNNFMIGGGDGFGAFLQAANVVDTHILIRDALADAVKAAGSAGITASIEHRIQNKTSITHTKIAVLSDPHYYAPELGTTGTAFENYLASDRKLLAESKATIESAIESIKNSDAQIVLVSGDLTKDGELLCHQQFAEHLKELTDAGKKVYVIDGNHDINNPDAVSYNGDQATPVANITPDQFKSIYHDYGYGDAVAVDPNSLSYVVDPVPGLRIVAMDSALYDTNIADNAPKTAGALSASRQAWIDAEIADGVAKGKTVIGMMHHGITNHFSMESQLFPEYVIQNADQVAADLSSQGMKMVFTGHFHAEDITEKQLPNNQFIFDIETGSLVTYPIPYRICDLASDGTLTIETNHVTNINYDTGNKSFPDYAKDILVNGLSKLVPEMLAGMIRQQQPSLTPDQALAAANTVASRVVAPTTSTVGELLVNAMVGHYQGDESTDSQLAALYQGMAASADPMTKTLGNVLLSLGTDLFPADNKVILNLNDGTAEQPTNAGSSIPVGTVVFSDGSAFDLGYANNSAHTSEIVQHVVNSQGIYVITFSGSTINNGTGKTLTASEVASLIPAVTYKDANGNIKKYSAGNGPEIN